MVLASWIRFDTRSYVIIEDALVTARLASNQNAGSTRAHRPAHLARIGTHATGRPDEIVGTDFHLPLRLGLAHGGADLNGKCRCKSSVQVQVRSGGSRSQSAPPCRLQSVGALVNPPTS